MNIDETYMSRALQLAKNGFGRVSPNPMVGAVVVADGRIIGEGFHRQWGHAHAEVNAVRMAYIGINFLIYVTLFKVQIYNYFVNDCIENVLNSQTKPKNLSYNVEY